MKRVITKKGRRVTTLQPNEVLSLSKKILNLLKPLSKKIQIVGSIRRKEPPVDIDIVLIPKDKQKILDKLSKKGKFLQGGEKRCAFKIQGVKVELYYAEPENWGAMLLTYTGPLGANIGLRSLAKKKNLLLNQYGIFDRKTKKQIAGKTERQMFEALGKKYKTPNLR